MQAGSSGDEKLEESSDERQERRRHADSIVVSVQNDENYDDEVSQRCCAVCSDQFKEGQEICSSQNPSCNDAFHYVEQCAICLDEFEDGDEICSSHNNNCKHSFHRVCIYYWPLKNEIVLAAEENI